MKSVENGHNDTHDAEKDFHDAETHDDDDDDNENVGVDDVFGRKIHSFSSMSKEEQNILFIFVGLELKKSSSLSSAPASSTVSSL